MITRYLSSAAVGVAVTTALLWVMQFLIEVSETVQIEPPSLPPLVIGRTIVERDPVIEEERPAPPDPPLTPPSTKPPAEAGGETILVGVPVNVETPPGPSWTQGGSGHVDSGLINIVHAQPEYPVRAADRGIEGYVVVEFDVTVLGTVENVSVIESSNDMFNKAAIKAASRSRYKPKTVDGTPLPTTGVRKLFRFEMEK